MRWLSRLHTTVSTNNSCSFHHLPNNITWLPKATTVSDTEARVKVGHLLTVHFNLDMRVARLPLLREANVDVRRFDSPFHRIGTRILAIALGALLLYLLADAIIDLF